MYVHDLNEIKNEISFTCKLLSIGDVEVSVQKAIKIGIALSVHLKSFKKIFLTIGAIFLLAIMQPAQAKYIVQFAEFMEGQDELLFLLDNEGHVWAKQDVAQTMEEADRFVKLLHLERIKKIVPFMALDDKGNVYTWNMNFSKSTFIDEPGGGARQSSL